MSGRTFLIVALVGAGASFVLVLGGAIYGASTLRNNRASEADIQLWRKQALRAFEDEELEVAQVLSERVLRYRPADAIIRSNLGRVYRRMADERPSDLYRAIAEHKLAIASRPDLPDLYYNVACYYAAAGEVDLAFDWLRMALQRGFGRQELLMTDPDLEALRADARFELVRQGKQLPAAEPRVEAHLAHDHVAPGTPVELEIVVERFVPEDAVASIPAPQIAWEPKAEGPLEELDRQASEDVEVSEGWVRQINRVRIRIVARTDGLLAVPSAKVTIGDREYETGALVLTVEAATPAEQPEL